MFIHMVVADVMAEVDRRLARIGQAGTADVPQVLIPVTGHRARRPHYGFTENLDVPRFGQGDFE